jgi:hypothetical protein
MAFVVFACMIQLRCIDASRALNAESASDQDRGPTAWSMEDQLARLQQERDELSSQLQAAATEQADLDRRYVKQCKLVGLDTGADPAKLFCKLLACTS